jgi:hypothetical protein
VLGQDWPQKAPEGPPLGYRLGYSGGQGEGPGRARWGALLMAPEEAAQYVGLSEAELLELHQRGLLPGVVLGDRLLFRRGDLAKVPARLGARLRGKHAGT